MFLTDGLNDLATHYGCCAQPARVRRPKDKALVEDAVHKSYRRIYAPLRNRVFHSLQELNAAVAELLEKYNSRRMQGCDYSRVERFLAVEKPELLLLACKISVQYGKCNYPFISNLVKSKCQGYLMQQEKDEENQASALPLHENIRGAQAYK